MIIFNRKKKIEERIVEALKISDMSGYELTRYVKVSAGSIYPVLASLVHRGIITSYWERGIEKAPRRRFYSLNHTAPKPPQSPDRDPERAK